MEVIAIISAYLIQTIIGIFLWKKVTFDWKDSILFSALLIPNVMLLYLVLEEEIFSFLRQKLKNKKSW